TDQAERPGGSHQPREGWANLNVVASVSQGEQTTNGNAFDVNVNHLRVLLDRDETRDRFVRSIVNAAQDRRKNERLLQLAPGRRGNSKVGTKRTGEWLVRTVTGVQRDVDYPLARAAQFARSSLEPQAANVLGQRFADKPAEDAMKVINRHVGDIGENRG